MGALSSANADLSRQIDTKNMQLPTLQATLLRAQRALADASTPHDVDVANRQIALAEKQIAAAKADINQNQSQQSANDAMYAELQQNLSANVSQLSAAVTESTEKGSVNRSASTRDDHQASSALAHSYAIARTSTEAADISSATRAVQHQKLVEQDILERIVYAATELKAVLEDSGRTVAPQSLPFPATAHSENDRRSRLRIAI